MSVHAAPQNRRAQVAHPTTPSSGVGVQRKCSCGSTKEPPAKECKECAARRLQRRLTVSVPGDPLEQEAEQVADRVLENPSRLRPIGRGSVRVQRLAAPQPAAPEAAPGVERALASPSQPLDPALRGEMQQRFGHDFSNVRVHVGPIAERSASDLAADAYTIGRDIVFGAGRYAPRTREGRRLIAHELTHVLQQSSHVPAASSAPRTVFRHAADKNSCLDDPDWKQIKASHRTVWLPANDAIEASYKKAHGSHAVLTGAQFEYGGKPGASGVQLPKGAPNRKSCNRLLSQFLGKSRQLAPDVMDCTDRVFYEIKTFGGAGKGADQLLGYYRTANAIAKAEDEPQWKIEYASWYPPHILPLGTTRRVCTEGTDYSRSQRPGLIVYQVQDRKDKKKKEEEEQREQDDKKKKDAAAAAARRAKMRAVRKLVNQLERELDMSEADHRTQRNLIYHLSAIGFVGFWTNQLFNTQPPFLAIWDDVYLSIERARTQLKAGNPEKAFGHFVKGRLAYVEALKTYMAWKNNLPGAAAKMETAIKVSAILAIAAFVAPSVIARAAGSGTSAATGTAANLAAAEQAVGQAAVRIAAGEARIAAMEASIAELEIVTAAELEAEMVVLRMLTF